MLARMRCRGFDGRERPRPLDHGFGAPNLRAGASSIARAHTPHRMLSQELQDPHESA